MIRCESNEKPIRRYCIHNDMVDSTDTENLFNIIRARDVIVLPENSILISAPKSTFALFTPDTHQSKNNPHIIFDGSELLLDRSPRMLGEYLNTMFSYHPL